MDSLAGMPTSLGELSSIEIPSRAQIYTFADELQGSFGTIEKSEIGVGTPAVGRDTRESIIDGCINSPQEVRDCLWVALSKLLKDPTKPRKAQRTFTRFTSLPLELRRKVWTFATEQDRIIEIINDRREKKWKAAPRSVVKPSMLLCCKEANVVVREKMARCFGTWFNLTSDTLWVNSMDYSSWPNYDSEFAIDLMNVKFGPQEETDRFKNTAWANIKHLMVTWELLEQAYQEKDENPFSVRRFSPSALPENFVNLKKLTLVFVEYIRDASRRMYTDNRELVMDDLEGITGARNLKTVMEIQPKIDYMFGKDRELDVEIKLLKRGNDGPGGVRYGIRPSDMIWLNLTEVMVLEEKEAEDLAAQEQGE